MSESRSKGGRLTSMVVRSVSPSELLGPLNEIERKFAPDLLYISGPLETPLPRPRVALIGTRQARQEALDSTANLAKFLSGEKAVVVSGLARGIDTAAHKATLAAGGRTVAVLGTPIDRTYPAENAELQNEIATRHLVVSQFPEGSPIQRSNFVLRNRTMALIADASVIMDSGETGGSLHQGWEALRLGRPLFIWHTLFENPHLRWPKEMTRYGAVELRDPEDLLEVLPSSTVGLTIDALI